jgi:hypothetical protein
MNSRFVIASPAWRDTAIHLKFLAGWPRRFAPRHDRNVLIASSMQALVLGLPSRNDRFEESGQRRRSTYHCTAIKARRALFNARQLAQSFEAHESPRAYLMPFRKPFRHAA